VAAVAAAEVTTAVAAVLVDPQQTETLMFRAKVVGLVFLWVALAGQGAASAETACLVQVEVTTLPEGMAVVAAHGRSQVPSTQPPMQERQAS
jgi:hypothetical protein